MVFLKLLVLPYFLPGHRPLFWSKALWWHWKAGTTAPHHFRDGVECRSLVTFSPSPVFSIHSPAGVAELADALDLGSSAERRRGSSPLSCIVDRRKLSSVAIWRLVWAAAVLPLGMPSAADNIHFTAPTPPLLGVTVTKLSSSAVFFRTSTTGPESSRPLADVTRLTIDRLPLLAQAESARTANRPADAVELYGRLLAAPTQPDVTIYVAQRLAESARLARRTDAATIAYIRLISAGYPEPAPYRPDTSGLSPASAEPALNLLRSALAQGKYDVLDRNLLTSLELELAAAVPSQSAAGQPTAKPDQSAAKSAGAPASAALTEFRAAMAATSVEQRKRHLAAAASALEALGRTGEAAILRAEVSQ